MRSSEWLAGHTTNGPGAQGVRLGGGNCAMTTIAPRRAEAATEAPREREQRATPLELFFDLVFVFAITQVTGFVSSDATWTRLLEGLAILAVLWFVWEAYAWLQNTAASDEGAIRVVMLAAMGA